MGNIRWCVDSAALGERSYSLDVQATSSFDAVMNYMRVARKQPQYQRTLPYPLTTRY